MGQIVSLIPKLFSRRNSYEERLLAWWSHLTIGELQEMVQEDLDHGDKAGADLKQEVVMARLRRVA